MKKELQKFIQVLREEGKYPSSVLDNLDAHLTEGEPESVVGSIYYEEPSRRVELMFQIVLKFALTTKS